MRAGGLIGIVAALALMGCAGTSSGGPAAVPSKACGGSHIVVHNSGHEDAAVSLNDQAVTSVAAGQSADIAEYGQYPAPAMPWDPRSPGRRTARSC